MRIDPLVIRRDGAVFSLRRICDDELRRLGKRAVFVEEDHVLSMQWNSRRRHEGALSLPEFLVEMSRAFGPSGSWYDDYKSSFCFPFHLTTAKGEVRGDYLLLVQDWKGGFQARVMRRESASHSGIGPPLPFVDAEFSCDDFRWVVSFLEGYLEGRCGAAKATAPPVPDFARRIDAANAVYGYRNHVPFAQSFANERDYSKALADTPDALFDVELEFSA